MKHARYGGSYLRCDPRPQNRFPAGTYPKCVAHRSRGQLKRMSAMHGNTNADLRHPLCNPQKHRHARARQTRQVHRSYRRANTAPSTALRYIRESPALPMGDDRQNISEQVYNPCPSTVSAPTKTASRLFVPDMETGKNENARVMLVQRDTAGQDRQRRRFGPDQGKGNRTRHSHRMQCNKEQRSENIALG